MTRNPATNYSASERESKAAQVARELAYARYAEAYLSAGWSPIPARGKIVLSDGVTGREGRNATEKDVERWAAKYPDANIAIRMPKGCIGVDVDDYDDKRGGETIAARERDAGSRLHSDYKITSREKRERGRSGIYLFRLPRGWEDYEFPGNAGPGVELIQRHHRYFMAPPSLHPVSRDEYRVIGRGVSKRRTSRRSRSAFSSAFAIRRTRNARRKSLLRRSRAGASLCPRACCR